MKIWPEWDSTNNFSTEFKIYTWNDFRKNFVTYDETYKMLLYKIIQIVRFIFMNLIPDYLDVNESKREKKRRKNSRLIGKIMVKFFWNYCKLIVNFFTWLLRRNLSSIIFTYWRQKSFAHRKSLFLEKCEKGRAGP